MPSDYWSDPFRKGSRDRACEHEERRQESLDRALGKQRQYKAVFRAVVNGDQVGPTLWLACREDSEAEVRTKLEFPAYQRDHGATCYEVFDNTGQTIALNAPRSSDA